MADKLTNNNNLFCSIAILAIITKDIWKARIPSINSLTYEINCDLKRLHSLKVTCWIITSKRMLLQKKLDVTYDITPTNHTVVVEKKEMKQP